MKPVQTQGHFICNLKLQLAFLMKTDKNLECFNARTVSQLAVGQSQYYIENHHFT